MIRPGAKSKRRIASARTGRNAAPATGAASSAPTTADAAVRAVVFDWDGTLLDSYHADATAYQKMFHALGIEWGMEVLEKHYSPNWHRVYRAAGIPRRRWAEADRLWRKAYAHLRPVLMPGARRVLRQLARGYVLGLVTSGNRTRVSGQLRKFGFTKVFHAAVFAEDARRRKPHPAPLVLALERMRVKPHECIYVGDSPEDIEMAQRAGVRAIAVLGPFPNHKRLRAAEADALLKSLEELPGELRRSGPFLASRRKDS
ncbi:MAG: HAD family hydrolase [Acidobacteria bacterium]|nr:HAD family hydrolase [Acidobacteriota bacterium]MBI3663104.1 HAD family hydrolase [Acidobacteriota bacterium]